MALLLSSVFGVTGCGSDDDVDVESRVKNIAPGLDASDAPSKAVCARLDFLDVFDQHDLRDLDRRLALLDRPALRDLLDRLERNDLDPLRDLDDRLDRRTLLGRIDLYDPHQTYDLIDIEIEPIREQCAAVSKSGADAPKGDDVERKES